MYLFLKRFAKKVFRSKSGHALVSVLFFSLIAVTISSAAVIVLGVNSLSTTKLQRGDLALSIAESGAEEAVLQLIRDPSYTGTGGTPLAVGDGNVVISVSGTGPIIVDSEGQVDNFVRTVRVTLDYNDAILSILSWEEVN